MLISSVNTYHINKHNVFCGQEEKTNENDSSALSCADQDSADVVVINKSDKVSETQDVAATKTNKKHNITKHLLLALLIVLPLIKPNTNNSPDTTITEDSTKKSGSLIEHVVNNVVEKKSEQKTKEDKPLESKLIKCLGPIINGVGRKLMSSAKVRTKVEEAIFNEKNVEKIDEYFSSQLTKDRVKLALEDTELKDALIKALGNKDTSRNVAFIMNNRKMQDAIISALNDPTIQDMVKTIGEKSEVYKPIVSAAQDVVNNPTLIRLAMNNKYLQEMVTEFLKNPDDGFKFKNSKELSSAKSSLDRAIIKHNKFINVEKDDNPLVTTCESIKTYTTVGAAAGEGVGDIVGYYIPFIGKPIFGTTGEVVGGIIGTVYGPTRNAVNEVMKLFSND